MVQESVVSPYPKSHLLYLLNEQDMDHMSMIRSGGTTHSVSNHIRPRHGNNFSVRTGNGRSDPGKGIEKTLENKLNTGSDQSPAWMHNAFVSIQPELASCPETLAGLRSL